MYNHLRSPHMSQRQRRPLYNNNPHTTIIKTGMGDGKVEEDGDKGEEDVADAGDVETFPYNNHTHKLPRYRERFHLHPGMCRTKQPNDNQTGHIRTLLNTLTTSTCVATVDTMYPVGTQVPHARSKHTTRNTTTRLIATTPTNTGLQGGKSAKKQCTKSPFHQIRAPTRRDG